MFNFAYLVKSGVSQLQYIDHANNLARIAHNGQVKVVPVMHLAESGLDAHIHGREIWVGGHNPDDTASDRVKTSSNDTENDVLAGEDTSD